MRHCEPHVGAERVVEHAQAIADGLKSGGRILVTAAPHAWPVAHHVAVEFTHPVTAGRQAVDAIVVTPERLAGWRRSGDVVIGVGIDVDDALSFPDPRTEGMAESTSFHHLVWETVHALIEDRELAADASFLGASATTIAEALRSSVEDKIATMRSERSALVESSAHEIDRAAGVLSGAAAVFTAGNGGSSTDASWFASMLAPTRPSLCLTDDVAFTTAVSNDVGFDVTLRRSVEVHGRAGDALVSFSTSGTSVNIRSALASARRLGIVTIGFTGPVLDECDGDADIMFNTRSSSIHRIQEGHVALAEAVLDRTAEARA